MASNMLNLRAGGAGRRVLAAAGALALLAVAALVFLWAERVALAERVLADVLAARGIAPVSFRVSSLGLRSIELADAALGEGDIAAGRIGVVYSFGELLSGRVRAIEISDLRVKARIDARGISFGAGDSLVRGMAGASGGGAGMDLPDVRIRSVTVDLATEAGRILLDGSLDLTQSDAASPAAIAVPALRVSDGVSPVRFAPVEFRGGAAFDGDVLTLDMEARSAAKGAGGGAALGRLTGRYSLASASGGAHMAGALVFERGKLEPQTVLPVLKGLVANAEGRVSYAGDVSLAKGALASSGRVTLDGLGFAAYSARFSGLDGKVELASLVPPRTKGPQTLSVGLLEAGVPLKDGRVVFELGGGAVTARLVEAVWPFAGGRLLLVPANGGGAAFDLTAEAVDLAALLRLADVPGLSGSGTISGRVPVIIENGDPVIHDGMLTALKGGVLVYEGGAAGGAGASEQMKLLTDALRNFHYTELSGMLNGNANGELALNLRLRGANPDLYEGYPFAISVNLEGSLTDLFRRGTVGFRPFELIRSQAVPAGKTPNDKIPNEKAKP